MDWKENKDGLHKTYEFKAFADAIGFMSFCRPAIDQLNHHPEWTNEYNRLEVRLRTHDAGNQVTEKDKQLAVLLDQKYQEFLSV